MSVDRPIFIVGTGRSGTTIFHQVFAHHPRVAFLSQLCARFPGRPRYNRWAMRMLDVPLLGRLTRRRLRPGEYYDFWEEQVRGFRKPSRDLSAEDVRPNVKQKLTKILGAMLTPRRSRILVKLTGWPRVRFLAEIFPDALFVHVSRDGRSVANSLLNTPFWDGWSGPPSWRFGELKSAYQDEWEHSGRSFVVLAGIQWKLLMDAFEEAKKGVPSGRFLEVRYGDFVADPKGSFGKVLAFCQLDYPATFKAAIDSFPMKDMDYQWQESLTPYQQRALEDSLKEHLVRYGYPLSLRRESAPVINGCSGRN